jgi:hypothetical protein
MKSVKSALAATGCFLLVSAGVLLLPPRWGIWLPDVVKPRAIVLDELTTTNGDHLRLTQLWIGDGYATELFHTGKDGQIWTFAIDGDARRAWSGSLENTNLLLRISVLGTTFFYDVWTHVITDRDGKPQMVEEIPRGTPIVPPR